MSQQSQALQKQYDQEYDRYAEFCSFLERELQKLIKEIEVSYFELSHRIKTWQSIQEKIERNSLAPNSIQDIYDVIGFRIITLFKGDIPLICDTIRKNLKVIWEDDKAKEKSDDAFGYLSVHFQVKLPEQWLQLPTAAGFSKFQAELQIRTFSQHVWAASSHLLQYKKESAVPYTMRRNIYRLAAVLEIVDNELQAILDTRKEYLASPRETGQPDQALDSILLEQILDDCFLKKNKKAKEPFDDLLQELLSCGISTVGQLRNILSDGEQEINRLEAKMSVKPENHFYSYAGKLRIALQFCCQEEYAKMRRLEKHT